MRNKQRMTEAQLRERLFLARAYIDLTKLMCGRMFPHLTNANLEALIAVMCVFVGEAEGRPPTVTKIAQHSGLTRQTVYRRLEYLIELGRVVRVGKRYYMAENAMEPDPHNRLMKILERARPHGR
ncbi:helix-turn-helix domain-containing protein [Bradyrhizobium sp. WSM 1738]|uniref:helix-turn-helix domain-containing protein n=1 Tax=Bradyrhizobium hereditatis TaxID=2821405 RepID=UPI001CE355A0|nr:helix-turn-helix domain-containing protein [Bradyrhizobium hereditatis]MCA6114283.1 helix-turn-helix domain-containing protein [Bradyrhizobium hereditatis]